MLTITRKLGQAIRIGDTIRVTIKEIRGRQIRLVIEAPQDIRVFREEIYEQIVAENERAAMVQSDLLKGLE